MPHRTVTDHQLHKDLAAVLHAANAGVTLTITVRERPVARLGPPQPAVETRTDVDGATILRVPAEPVDAELASDVDAAEASA